MAIRKTTADFQQALTDLANLPPDADAGLLEGLNTRLRETFLAMGSETPDNLDCMRHLEVGPITDGTSLARPCWGLRLAGTGEALSEVMNCAEGMDVPATVLERYPTVSQSEWDALFRFATMILSAFESAPAADD
jgi:hypothetical protein